MPCIQILRPLNILSILTVRVGVTCYGTDPSAQRTRVENGSGFLHLGTHFLGPTSIVRPITLCAGLYQREVSACQVIACRIWMMGSNFMSRNLGIVDGAPRLGYRRRPVSESRASRLGVPTGHVFVPCIQILRPLNMVYILTVRVGATCYCTDPPAQRTRVETQVKKNQKPVSTRVRSDEGTVQ